MFITDLLLKATVPGRWVLIADLVWEGAVRFVVPAGFETDLASIPKAVRNILNQNGRSRKAAVLHDFLYRTAPITRVAADALFREALRAEGMGLWARGLYWMGVRLGGRGAWYRTRPRSRKPWKT